ncbi:hypothetical protein M9458_006923, partial [Cirrhinus mrigala]
MSSRPQRKRDKKDNTDLAVDDLGSTSEVDVAQVGAIANSEAEIQPDNSVILSAINGLKSEFLSQYKDVLAAVKEVREDFSSFAGRLTEAESRIGQAEDDISDLQGRVSKLERTALDLASALDLAECRSRRSNIRILGLPNGIEGNIPVSFLENWLPQVLGADSFPAPWQSGWKHTLKAKNNDTEISQLCRQRKVMFQNHHIMFFPDLSPEVLKRRKRFDDVKRELRRRNIKLLVNYRDC